jgi:DNA-binding response OmpR family regulator
MALPDLEAKGLEAGATLSIRKPFNPEQVVSTVEQLLGRPRSPETP